MTGADGYQWYRWADDVRAIDGGKLRPATKLVADTLASHAANETGECFPSEVRLARCCGLKLTREGRNRAVQTAVQELRDLGALEVLDIGRGRKSTRYRLIPREQWDEGRTSVRVPSDPDQHDDQLVMRTSVRGRGARVNAAEAHNHAREPRTTVRPELPTEALNGAADETAPPLSQGKQQQPTPPPDERTSSETGLANAGLLAPAVVVEEVVVGEETISLRGKWARKSIETDLALLGAEKATLLALLEAFPGSTLEVPA